MSRLFFIFVFFKAFLFSFHQRTRPTSTTTGSFLSILSRSSSKSTRITFNAVGARDAMEEIGYQENSFKSGFITIIGNPNVGKY